MIEPFLAAVREASERFVPYVIECAPWTRDAARELTRALLALARTVTAVAPAIAAPAARGTAPPARSGAGDARHAQVMNLKKAELAVHAAMVSVALGGAALLAGKWLVQ